MDVTQRDLFIVPDMRAFSREITGIDNRALSVAKLPRVAGVVDVCGVLWRRSGADAQGLFTEVVGMNVDAGG